MRRAWSLSSTTPPATTSDPGTFVYPTDPAYIPGSFDLRRVALRDLGDAVEIQVRSRARFRTHGTRAPGAATASRCRWSRSTSTPRPTRASPTRYPASTRALRRATRGIAWCSSRPRARRGCARRSSRRAGAMKSAVVLPRKVSPTERGLVALVDRKALGGAPSARWGVQAVVGPASPSRSRATSWRGESTRPPARTDSAAAVTATVTRTSSTCSRSAASGAAEEVSAQQRALAYERAARRELHARGDAADGPARGHAPARLSHTRGPSARPRSKQPLGAAKPAPAPAPPPRSPAAQP